MPLHGDYRLRPGPPTLSDYLRLRRESGLSPKDEAQGAGALTGSWAFRHVVDASGDTVGMGRVIGDGAWYFLITDMATLPEHQGRGIGGAVLDALLKHIAEDAPVGAYITLTADPPGRHLYELRGFVDVAPQRTGMHLVRPAHGAH